LVAQGLASGIKLKVTDSFSETGGGGLEVQTSDGENWILLFF
jgi:hypothetical protein